MSQSGGAPIYGGMAQPAPHGANHGTARPPARRPPARAPVRTPARPTPPPSRPTPPPARPTNPLAPLSSQQIRQQATRTISQAYGGAFTDINNAQTQAQNLYATQQHDNAAFSQWLATQGASMQAQTDAVNQKLIDVMNGIRQSGQIDALPGAAATQENAQAGMVNAPGQVASGLAAVTAPTTGAADERVAASTARDVTSALAGNALLAGSQNVALGRINQAQMGQLDQLNKTVNSIAAERTKLLASRTGDIAKEIARLQGVEISKAQYQQNQSNLATELGIKQQGVNVAKTNAATSQVNALTAQERAAETQRHNSAMEKIDATHYASQQQHDAAVAAETQRHDKAMEGTAQQNANTRAGEAGVGKLPPGVKPATKDEIRSTFDSIAKVANALRYDIERYHKGQANAISLAWHDLHNPNNVRGDAYLAAVYKAGYPDAVINAASNTLTQYGAQGLSPGDIQWLNSQGITTTENLPVNRHPRGTGGRGGGRTLP